MKLYPPILEGTIPAFCGTTLTVPFTMNKSVSRNQIAGFALKLKTVQNYNNGAPVFNISTGLGNWVEERGEVSFSIPAALEIGQFYKIQIAYVYLDGTIGYYSTVGVVKYISDPKVEILDPTDGKTYTGVYSQKITEDEEVKDFNEKVYSYSFTLTDSNGNIVETSGEKLHNSQNDTELYESIDNYTIITDLKDDEIYYLDYTIKTINGFIKSASTKRLSKIHSIDSSLETDLVCSLDYENGCVDIQLMQPKHIETEKNAVGSFYLLRASDEDNYSSWNEVLKFILRGEKPSRHLWKDMTVKQGVSYKYAIQQYNNHGLRTNKIESKTIDSNGLRISTPIFVDFEYAYLFDGERQLKIKYNPKVASFKNTLLESKIDTIGSKHPFIFRNGNVNYKEFPISGLISYLSDENNLFYDTSSYFNEDIYRSETVNSIYRQINISDYRNITASIYNENKNKYYCKVNGVYMPWEQYFKEKVKTDPVNKNIDFNTWSEVKTIIKDLMENDPEKNKDSKFFILQPRNDIGNMRNTNLTANNILVERNFKLEVLEWLTNGKPKLFRSPTEGNYIVRLMNVSLSPSDQLGRMIHTFNCTAYEIAENTYSNLSKYNFVKVDVEDIYQLRWLSVDLSNQNIQDGKNLLNHTAAAVSLEGMLPGDKFQITVLEDRQTKTYDIVIGATGNYIISLENDIEILSVYFKGSGSNQSILHQGLMTYAYYSTEYKDRFDTVETINNKQIACRQFIGACCDDIIKEIQPNDGVKDQIDSFGFIRFTLRDDSIPVYQYNGKFYIDDQVTNELDDLSDLTNIYQVYTKSALEKGVRVWDVNEYYWIDGSNFDSKGDYKKISSDDKKATQIIFNGDEENPVDIRETYSYVLKKPKNITSLKIGDAIICEMCYSQRVINYDLEQTESQLIQQKQKYQDEIKKFENAFAAGNTSRKELRILEQNCQKEYKIYTEALYNAIKEAERR